MITEELNHIREHLERAPLDWDLRLSLIQYYVFHDQLDEAKKVVRESPDAAGPAPPHVQYRLHRLMTEGRSAAEEFARQDGQALSAGGMGTLSQPSHTEGETGSREEASAVAEIPDIPEGPAGTSSEVEELPEGIEALFGMTVDEEVSPVTEDSRKASPTHSMAEDTVESEPVFSSQPEALDSAISDRESTVEENPVQVVDPSVKQRELDDSRFFIASVDELKPMLPKANAGGKASAVAIALIVHVVLIIGLMFIVMSDPRPQPPRIVAVKAEESQVLEVPPKRMQQVSRSSAAAAPVASSMVITTTAVSPVTMSEVDVSDVNLLPSFMTGLGTGSGRGGKGFGSAGKGGMIGGMKIRSQRLGVVLDVSGSMDAQIREVRKEIRKNFSTARVVEVIGCSLDWRDGESGNEGDRRRIRLKREADSVVEAVEMLVVDGKVDAIFWFSDLMDIQTEAGEKRLSQLLGTQFGSQRRPVKFYVQSVDREPSNSLAGIAKRSGGATKVQRFE